MAKMAKDIRAEVVNGVMEGKNLRGFLEGVDAVRFDENKYAVPVVGDDGKVYWLSLAMSVGLWEPTKVNPAFDPHAKQAAWLAAKAEGAEKAAEKEKAKQAKIKRDTAKREKAAADKAAKEAPVVPEA